MGQRVIVTTSWDDGHKLDIRLVALLKKYGIKSTLYVSPRDREFARSDLLTREQVKTLAKDVEIGAHTMTHPRLHRVSDDEAQRELVGSKRYLERLLKRPVTTFCYPGGDYYPRHARMAAEAGFTYARTVKRHSFVTGPLLEGLTTVNAYNHYQDLWKIAIFARFNPIKTWRYFQWDNLAIAMFDHARKHGGTYHLWGHSWEIDQHNDWEKLERVLQYISDKKDVHYVANGELPGLQPKKVLIAAPYFPPHLGGQEYYAANIAKQLQKHFGWDVAVAATGSRGWRTHVGDEAGLRVYRLPYWLKVSNTPINPLWWFSMRRIIHRERPDVLNAHAPVPLFADLFVRAARRIPSALTYHMVSMQKGIARLDWMIKLYEQRVLPRTLHRTAAIICASTAVRDNFLQAFRAKSAVVPSGVDATFFTPARTMPAGNLLFVASLNKSDSHKGLAYLLEAMPAVIQAHPKARLHIVGTGTGRTQYEAHAKRLGVSKHVRFLGAQYGKDIRKAYQHATIFVLPSTNENAPLTVLEAMAASIPVVSTKVGALSQLVDNGRTGYLVEPARSDLLAEKITYLLEHPTTAKRFGAAGRRKVTSAFTWRMQAELTNEVLTNIYKKGQA